MKPRRLVPVCAFLLALTQGLSQSVLADCFSAAPDFADQSSAGQGTVDDYMRYGLDDEYNVRNVPIVGMTIREDTARLSTGQHMSGIGVLAVSEGGPAASAGIGHENKAIQAAMAIATVAAVVLFPPAAFGIAAIAQSEAAQSHDVIVAVDGDRTRSLMEFDQAMGKASPGEIVYMTIIRSGERRHLRVLIPLGAEPLLY